MDNVGMGEVLDLVRTEIPLTGQANLGSKVVPAAASQGKDPLTVAVGRKLKTVEILPFLKVSTAAKISQHISHFAKLGLCIDADRYIKSSHKAVEMHCPQNLRVFITEKEWLLVYHAFSPPSSPTTRNG